MIEVSSVSKWYGEKRAICELSFSIGKGEIVGLLGLNGAGKSTLLKILSTLTPPSEGEARLAGYSVRRDPLQVRREIGYLPDTPPLYEEMTVTSYLQFVAKLKGVERPRVRSYVDEAIEKTNLGNVAGKNLSDLSHGFKQRTSIAQALVHKPKILILDEPINGLDPIQIVEMRDLIVSLKTDHTLILSSHILSEITKTCDRILVIDQGHLVAEGSEAQLRGLQGDQFAIELRVAETESSRLEALEQKFDPLDSILSFQRQGSSFTIHAREDIRSDLARLVVTEGFSLLELKQTEAELEKLFLHLVSGEKF